jgi:hypothetical protein
VHFKTITEWLLISQAAGTELRHCSMRSALRFVAGGIIGSACAIFRSRAAAAPQQVASCQTCLVPRYS